MSAEDRRFLPGLESESNATQSAAVMLIKFEDDTPYFLASKRLDRNGVTFPGGKLEEGETPEDGALREVFEETGVKIYSSEYLISAHPRRNGIPLCDNSSDFNTHIYFAFIDEATDGEEPVNVEFEKHAEWQWIPVSELPKMVSAGELHHAAVQDFMLTTIEECIELQLST